MCVSNRFCFVSQEEKKSAQVEKSGSIFSFSSSPLFLCFFFFLGGLLFLFFFFSGRFAVSLFYVVVVVVTLLVLEYLCVCVCVCVLRCLTACIFPEKKYESTYPVYLPLLLCSDFISIQEALCLIFVINICFFLYLFACVMIGNCK